MYNVYKNLNFCEPLDKPWRPFCDFKPMKAEDFRSKRICQAFYTLYTLPFTLVSVRHIRVCYAHP